MRNGMTTALLVTPETMLLADRLATEWPDLLPLSSGLLARDVARRYGVSEREAFNAVGLARENARAAA